MSTEETAEEIDACAVFWAMRLEGDGLSEADEERLQAWLREGDARRLGALARSRAVVVNSRRMAALTLDAASDAAFETRTSRRRMLGAGLAASILLGVGTGAALWRRSQVFETGRGEVRSVTLPDGTRVSLSAMSRVSIRYSSTVRQVALTFGEALFDIAPDSSRLFVIQSAGAVLTASAGRFLFDRTSQAALQVAALEGRASLLSRSGTETVIQTRELIRLENGPMEDAEPFDSSQAAQMLAWTDSKVALDDDTLAAAAQKMGRFRGAPIIINDPEVAALTITGLFDANDSATFARAAAFTLDLHAEISPDRIVLKRL